MSNGGPAPAENLPMFPPVLSERLDALIDELIMSGGVEAASLASILLAAKDSVKCDYHVTLSRRVWAAVNEIRPVPARTGTEHEFEFEAQSA